MLDDSSRFSRTKHDFFLQKCLKMKYGLFDFMSVCHPVQLTKRTLVRCLRDVTASPKQGEGISDCAEGECRTLKTYFLFV